MIYHRQACDGDNGSLVIVLMTMVAPIRRYFIPAWPRGDPNKWRCKVPAIYLPGPDAWVTSRCSPSEVIAIILFFYKPPIRKSRLRFASVYIHVRHFHWWLSFYTMVDNAKSSVIPFESPLHLHAKFSQKVRRRYIVKNCYKTMYWILKCWKNKQKTSKEKNFYKCLSILSWILFF